MSTSNPSSRSRTVPPARSRPASPARPGAPARRQTSNRPRLSVWEKIKLVSGMLTLLLILALTAGSLYAGYILRQTNDQLGSVESLTDYHPGGVTRIYATDKDPSTGRPWLLAELYTQYREYASIKEIPDVVKDATTSIEDERFYDHVGVDLWAIGRALYRNVTKHRVSEGASTLTQQLARTLVLKSQANTLERKLKEAMIAVQLERNYSKDQILEMYLNEVNYGGGAFGIKGAAKVYFNKPLNKLTLSEAALLSGLPKNPTGLTPFRNLDGAVKRRNVVLKKMLELGKAKHDDVAKAKKEKPKIVARRPGRRTFRAPFFCNYVIDQLDSRYTSTNDGEEGGVKDRGYSIYTTLNFQMQKEAEQAIKLGVAANAYKGVTEAALVSVEPKTGYIRAMVGGVNYQKYQYNNAAQGKGRQPGSTFKAVVYSAAFSTGNYGPYSSVSNERVSYGSYSPDNFDGRYGGYVSITNALKYSMNVPAVRVANQIGIRRVVDMAVKMGIPRDHFPANPNLAIALGAAEATPLQMAGVYSVFANGGNFAHPMAVIRVVDTEGNTILSNQPAVDKQVISETTAANMSEMFRKTVTEGTARAATGIFNIPNAHAKTGTTSARMDIWFAGYTPELSTVVWACNVKYVKKGGKLRPIYDSLDAGSFGGSTCGPIWVRFMQAAVPIQRKFPGAGRVPIQQVVAAVNKGADVTTRQSGSTARQSDDSEEPRPRRRRRYRRRRSRSNEQGTTAAQSRTSSAPAESTAAASESSASSDGSSQTGGGGESGGGGNAPQPAEGGSGGGGGVESGNSGGGGGEAPAPER